MGAHSKSELTKSQISQIKAEIKQAALDHLNATDAKTALSHFTDDVMAVSNTQLFSNYEALAKDVRAYYGILKEVNLAVWDEMHINVINENTAVVTAKFRYGFTDTNDERTNLQGVWTTLYARRSEEWQICVRHESFENI